MIIHTRKGSKPKLVIQEKPIKKAEPRKQKPLPKKEEPIIRPTAEEEVSIEELLKKEEE